MAEGTSTYDGLAVPLSGESEITQTTVGNDILTLTGAASQTGDFLVCQNSTGGENLVISSSGLITSVVGMAMTSAAFSGIATATVSSSATLTGFNVVVTSTGAIAAGALAANGFMVSPSSKANMNAAYAYTSDPTCVGTTQYLLGCHGSKSPDYFLGVGATRAGLGAPADNGFLDTNLRYLAAPDTADVLCGVKMLAGSMVVYLLAAPATLVEIA